MSSARFYAGGRPLSLFVRHDVATLYVDARGPYPERVAHWADERDDATKYDGPLPVVAHPPCGPWGRLRHLSTLDDPKLALVAVEQVRRWGGVLEHPAGSKLWDAVPLPKPGEPADAWAGASVRVEQVDWGHVARKPTWLYVVGVAIDDLGPMPPKGTPTHWISGSRQRLLCGTCQKSAGSCACVGGFKAKPGVRGYVPAGIKVCGYEQRRRTPPAFADWLLALAARCAR